LLHIQQLFRTEAGFLTGTNFNKENKTSFSLFHPLSASTAALPNRGGSREGTLTRKFNHFSTYMVNPGQLTRAEAGVGEGTWFEKEKEMRSSKKFHHPHHLNRTGVGEERAQVFDKEVNPFIC